MLEKGSMKEKREENGRWGRERDRERETERDRDRETERERSYLFSFQLAFI